MKAKTMAKPLKNPINLSKSPVRFTPTGSIEPVAQRGRAHPGASGCVRWARRPKSRLISESWRQPTASLKRRRRCGLVPTAGEMAAVSAGIMLLGNQ